MRLCEEIYISYFQFWDKLPLSNDMISDIDSVLEAISNYILFFLVKFMKEQTV